MELYAGAALTGMGYLLNKQRDILRKSATPSSVPEPRDKPSMNNIYESNYWTTVKKDEQKRGDDMYAKSKTPLQSGVVPKPAYASMFAATEGAKTYSSKQTHISSLTGEEIPVENFTHNNMQPYFRGTAKQNLDPYANSSLLENYTGRGDLLIKKQETQCFFEPTANLTNVCGMQNNADYYLDHISAPVARRNEFPIEQIRVGPGLNKGYSAMPSGGFQQTDTLDYLGYKTVDELRPLSKPKVSLEAGPQAPMKGVTTERGLVGDFAKNRPDTYYEQTPEQWLRTTGANQKERSRPVQLVKPTSRVETHVQYGGSATGAAQPGKGHKDDYGKASIVVYDNERMQTETRTVVSNVTSIVKAIVAPFADILRHNTKEYTVDSARTFGSMQAQIPSKPTLYDPVTHMMKTTVKETTEDAARTFGTLTGHGKHTAHDPDNIAKTTVKETTEEAARAFGAMSAQIPSKATVYDPVNHIMRTTIKETTIHDTEVANLKGGTAGTVHSEDDARTTVRETLPLQDTTRNIAGHTYRVVVYSPEAVAKTTVKETTTGAVNEFGFVGGSITGSEGAYTHIEVQVPNTQKQFISDNDYYGASMSKTDFRPVSDAAERNAEIDGTREMLNIAAGHTPNAGGLFISTDPDNVSVDTKKAEVDRVAPRAMGNVSRITQGSPNHTQKCELSRGMPQYLNGAENRLDPGLLSTLKENPFNLNINPIY